MVRFYSFSDAPKIFSKDKRIMLEIQGDDNLTHLAFLGLFSYLHHR